MVSTHDVDVLVQEIERDGTAVTGRRCAFFSVVCRHGDLVCPEQAVDCSGAKTWDVLTH